MSEVGFSVLDATAGGKHIWHREMQDADHVVFADRRRVEKGEIEQQPSWSVEPDVLADTRALPFRDRSFDLIAYDPPHRVTDGGMPQISGIIETKYGALRAETWQRDLGESFDELWRVLRAGGTLTFKWADVHKSHGEVLRQLPETPLYGVTTEKKRSEVKWWVFHKHETPENAPLVAATDGGQGGKTDTGSDRND